MRVLIVGNGGREHALLWKLREDAPEASFFATRPNAGMAESCTAVDLAPEDVSEIAQWATAHRIDLAVIGPEAPLAAGAADLLESVGVPVFGPSGQAARIESSKAFAKDLMAEAGIPTARYQVHTDPDRAAGFIRSMGAPVVVKASGLAAGKGVLVCSSVAEGIKAARQILRGSFGSAGRRIVIEEYLDGEELSVFCVTDGEEFVTLLPSQDHKRIGEADTGPNTGGMGAYAPVGFATASLIDDIGKQIVRPALRVLAGYGSPFRGLLYAGLMITSEGPRVVEFNCRFGDPETQAVLPLLASSLLDLLLAVAERTGLRDHVPEFRDGAAVSTVVAAQGYPGAYAKGQPVTIPDLSGIHVFHAGTAPGEQAGSCVTSGGRVLSATAVRASFRAAQAASQAAAHAIGLDGKQFRRDIGWREAARLAATADQRGLFTRTANE